jgi:hypothetical protein
VRSVQAAVAALAVAGLALAAAFPAATHSGHARHAVPHPSGVALIGGVPIQQARCSQWNAGGVAERDAVVAALASSVGGFSTGGGRGTTLTSGESYRLFNRACASPIARGFLLYELYIRAAGFRSLGSAQT